ncbi:MAG: hypothetical protein J6M30_09060 [Bacteroidales bacterium]|nr:hypothetical protein [Bacteroidales bacterium]
MDNELLNCLTSEEIRQLQCCTLCPHKCGVNRLKGEKGFCRLDLSLAIALVINHKGEEPVLSRSKGVTNVFFSHCNSQCLFCQNHRISCNTLDTKNLYPTVTEVTDKITEVLQTSENVLGFVSPTHQLPVMKALIREVNNRGLFPKIVYNCGGYEDVQTLEGLEGTVDVYLPDWKYADKELGRKYSSVRDYSQKAKAAIKEMYRQKGSSVLTDIDGNIESGLIIRHLILPGCTDNSKKVLDEIAWELSPNVTLSLMSQYNPPFQMPYSNLNRKITEKEYNEVLDFALSLGFHKIYSQDLTSTDSVIPDFDNNTFIRNGDS